MFCLFVCFGGKQVNNHTLHLFCSEGCTSCYQKEQKMGQVRQEEGGSYHKLNGVFPGAVLGAASPPSAHPAHSSHPLWLCRVMCVSTSVKGTFARGGPPAREPSARRVVLLLGEPATWS